MAERSSKSIYCMVKTPIKQCGLLPNHSMMPEYKPTCLTGGLNGLRMYPVPADVRRLMYKVKHAQGVDITRIFCGLNEVRNIIPSIHYALEGGMIPQATLCITFSPVHTVEYYTAIADKIGSMATSIISAPFSQTSRMEAIDNPGPLWP